MRHSHRSVLPVVLLGASLTVSGAAIAAAAETPVRGGTLEFVVGSTAPSYDAHQETTFGVIHPIGPFYSLLIRVNPDNPKSTNDFVCDDPCQDLVTKLVQMNAVVGKRFDRGRPLMKKIDMPHVALLSHLLEIIRYFG